MTGAAHAFATGAYCAVGLAFYAGASRGSATRRGGLSFAASVLWLAALAYLSEGDALLGVPADVWALMPLALLAGGRLGGWKWPFAGQSRLIGALVPAIALLGVFATVEVAVFALTSGGKFDSVAEYHRAVRHLLVGVSGGFCGAFAGGLLPRFGGDCEGDAARAGVALDD